MIRSYDLKVGYTCDHDCLHCVIKDSKRDIINSNKSVDLTTDECLSLIDQASERGVDSITLTGGEPTLRRDFPVLVGRCLSHSMLITLQTNGGHLSSADVVKAIRGTDAITYVIALHGATAKVHDAITRTPGSFEKTIEGIRRVRDLGKPVILKTVISRVNMESLGAMIDMMSEEQLKDVNMAFPHAQGAARENFDEVVPRYGELRPHLLQAARKAKALGVNLTFETVPFCILPEFPEMASELIYKFKEVECNQVHEDRFDWNRVRVSIKRKSDKCSSCVFCKYCEGPWCEYVERFGYEEFLPVHVK